MSAIMKEEFSLEQIAAAIVAIRDEITKINKEADKKVKGLEREKEALEKYCDQKLESAGAETVKTASGTIMRQEKIRFTTEDWERMYQFIEDNDAFELLEKRIHQTNMRRFLEDNPDKEPKGLNAFRETKIVVRRS
jgi:hypothetical protein|tara:strand:+ start:1120 stop:1527 length:408 start_codon:yes stop_codon:yes gene_type:complete